LECVYNLEELVEWNKCLHSSNNSCLEA